MASVLITGAARRLGAEMAIHLAKQGYNIALHHFSDPAETVAKILKQGVICKTYYSDLSVDNTDFFDQITNDFKDLEILINNASIFHKKKYEDLSKIDYDHLMNIHLKNPLFLSQKFGNLLNAKLIINMADALANPINGCFFLHSLSKSCMLQMSSLLAKNLAPKVRVNSISPGYIAMNDEKNAPKNKTLLQANGTVDKILITIDYLIKNNYITGQNINVDGGGFTLEK